MDNRKHRRFLSLKQRNLEIAKKFESIDMKDRAMRIRSCGDYVKVSECMNCGTKHFAGFYRCKDKFCLLCEWKKRMYLIAKVLSLDLFNKYKVTFATYTVRSMGNLDEMINKFQKIWYDFTHQRWFRGRYQGFLASTEVTYNKESGWHYHMHVLLFHEEFSKDFEIQKELWKRLSLKYGIVGSVFLEGVKHNIEAYLEVLKYIFDLDKIKYLDDDVFSELVHSMYKRQQYRTGGVLRVLLRNLEQELDKIDDEQIENFICSKCGFTKAKFYSIFYDDVDVLYDSKISNERDVIL